MSLHSPRVVVGLTGGIAAYKVVSVIRELVAGGCDVHVVPSESALNFIGRATLEAISRNPVYDTLFDGVAEVRHVALGQSADVILVAPATANTLSALATGRADTLMLTTILASRAPLVVAPAMHTEMWENAATRSNLATLLERGVTVVGPGVGRLTGNDSGIGRLAEPRDIVAAVSAACGPHDLVGLHIVVTAGGTREPIDPVRYIGNRSSGIQGIALATAAQARGAAVTLIAGAVDVPLPPQLESIRVETAEDMRTALLAAHSTADVVIMAAAVSDYRVENVAPEKLKKAHGVPHIRLVENPDILAELGSLKSGAFLVGFAAETNVESFAEFAADKARRKGTDLLVANSVANNAVFGSQDTDVQLFDRRGDVVDSLHGSKLSVAHRILDHISRWKDTHK